MNKWEIYELLKGNNKYNIDELNDTDKDEIIEGIEEYVYTTRHITTEAIIEST